MTTITTIAASDLITNSRAVINDNFSALNTGKIESSYLDTDTTLTANSDTKIPSQKAVKAYVDAGGNPNASTTQAGNVQEASAAQVLAKTDTGSTGARLFINPSTLTFTSPVRRVYLTAGSPATWTKPAGLKYIDVEVQAGGGGGGSSSATANAQGGGGGSGAYSRKLILTAALGATETVTTGVAGTAGSLGNGGTGGNSSFGTHATATGGIGGNRGSTGGGGGSAASGDINISGIKGEAGCGTSGIYQGSGAQSILGIGGYTEINTGTDATGYGAGGSGGKRTDGEYYGGAGGAGVVIVNEYYV